MRQPSATGVLVAAAAWVVGWTPSLLPGGSVLQGVSLGLLAATGYAFGSMVAAVLSPVIRTGRWFTALAWAAAGLAVLSGLRLGRSEATQAASLGTPQFAANWLVSSAVGLAVVITLVAVARGIRGVTRILADRLARIRSSSSDDESHPVVGWRPRLLAAGVVAVVGVGLGAAALAVTHRAFDAIDAATSGQQPPSSATRSGSAESSIEWSTLGRQGRDFVAGGDDPSTIRAFAGLNSAPDPRARADAAVADMLRAGGGQAEVWIGITTTGNGFVDPVAAQAAETVSDGRAALVAIQYSTLPSWLAFLIDQPAAKEAGIALFDSLRAARDALPEGQRPRLVLYGESLGAYGSPAPFAGLDPEQVAGQIDGALWVGPPAATDPITDWTYRGSPPVWQPVVDAGRVARYAATDASTGDPPPGSQPWPDPHILVLQNPTDPVVWFSPRLVWQHPPWLASPRGPGVDPDTRWTPLLFFLQVALDLPQAVDFPSGVGHNYSDALQRAWEQILTP